MKASRGANVGAVLRAINPIVRGWTAYYRTVVKRSRHRDWPQPDQPPDQAVQTSN
jgi:hypothetical protein